MTLSSARPLIPATSRQSLIFLVIAIFIVAAVSFLGSSATAPSIPAWYVTLKKPSFNPPNWAFPIAWSILFALMAFSFWRILRQVERDKLRNHAILAFLVQIVLNAGWSFAFFAARSPLAGLVVIFALLAAIFYMIMTFRRIDPLAGNLQWPYLGWVSFATLLNGTIWWIN